METSMVYLLTNKCLRNYIYACRYCKEHIKEKKVYMSAGTKIL